MDDDVSQDAWPRFRGEALESMEILARMLRADHVEDRELTVAYLDTKKRLARAFEAKTIAKYTDPSVLAAVKDDIETSMTTLYSFVPIEYRRVREFGSVHELLLAFFVRRVGQDVSANELRILTGDAVHTERRARSLRDLGFALEVREQSGEQVYRLVEDKPDVDTAAKFLLLRNIGKAAKMHDSERVLLVSRINSAL
jgi:hypothetical protein